MLSPEEIKSREFLVSLRGYDRDEVHAFLGRIAEELTQTQSRAQQLEQEVERLRREREQAPAAQPEAAASPASAAFAEIGRETQRILEAAQEAGQQMQRRARQEADKELQNARSQAARQIAEGERRREQIERVVRALDEARAALATDLRNVSRSIDQTLKDLSPTETPSTSVRKAMETEARMTGDRSAGRAAGAAGTTDTGASGAATAEPTAAPTDSEAPAEEPEPAPTAPEQDDTSTAAVEEATTGAPEPDTTPEVTEEPTTEELAEEGAPAEDAAAGEAAGDEEPSPQDVTDEAGPAVPTDVAAPDAGGAPDTRATEMGQASAGSAGAAAALLDEADVQPATETPDVGAETDADTASPAEATSSVETASQTDAEAEAEQPETSTEPATVDAQPESAATAAPAPTAGRQTAGRDPAGLRAAALSPLHPKLVRKLKRELQEVQNIALDRVRRSGGRGEVDDFLPQGEDARILGEGAAEFLEQAWNAGVTAAATLAERDLGDAGDAPELVGMFAEEATERVRASLGATLRMGMSAGEPPQALSDRIGAVFSELKGTSAEELSATHLIHAYETGLLSTWRAGGITARTWVLGREPRCPEARCRQNDQSGPLPLDQSFPSGHEVPPVHVGCTCTTVPAQG